jgi:DNA-binding NarL/FixJ family response regulator
MVSTAIPLQIVIADTQFLVTESLKYILQNEGNYIVQSVIESKYELLKTLRNNDVSILITDFAKIDFEGFSDLKDIANEFKNLHILILADTISKNELIELNNAGIKNIVHKTITKDELFDALNATSRGKSYYSGDLLDTLFELNEKKSNSDETGQLTASEIEIVRLVAEGLTTKEIAARKHISFHTVTTHRKNIFRKLGVTNASELLMYAIKAGFIDTIEYHI